MFDIGWTELLLIGLVALIVVGPKDLPGMFRTLGQFTAKAKRMAREFQKSMEDAADEAGVKDVSDTFRKAMNPKDLGLDAVKKAASFDSHSHTGKLAKERAEAAEKYRAATAKTAEARLAKEAAATEASAKPAEPPVAKTPAKSAPAKKTTKPAKPKAKAAASAKKAEK